jgi:hypothetical protein
LWTLGDNVTVAGIRTHFQGVAAEMNMADTTLLAAVFVASLLGTPGASAQGESLVMHPHWTKRPSWDDLRKLYPKGVRGVTADVVASCRIDDQGRFTSCDIVRESPSGLGFGESTIRLSKLFQMRTIDGDGSPVAGRKLSLPVRWDASLSR